MNAPTLPRFLSRPLAALAALALLAFAGGCGHEVKCDPARYAVSVRLDDSLRDSSGQMRAVEVHLVGVTATDKEKWDSYSMTKYWRPTDKFRDSALKYTMNLGGTHPPEQTLPANDRVWDTWLGDKAGYLYVVANLPGAFEDQLGDREARRQSVTIESCRWNLGNAPIRVLVKAGGVTILSQPVPDPRVKKR